MADVGSSRGSLETSLRSLVQQVRSQLEILQRENDAKDKDIEQYKLKVMALEKLIENKAESEHRLIIEKNEMKEEFETQTLRHESIQGKLINQVSNLRNEMQNIELRYRTDLANNSKKYTFEIEQLNRNYKTIKIENESLKQKLTKVEKEHKTVEQNLKENYRQHELTQERLQQEIKSLQAEKENAMKDITHLQGTITNSNQSVYDLQKVNIDLKNENKALDAKFKASLNNINYLKKQIQYYQSQSKIINNALNGKLDSPQTPAPQPQNDDADVDAINEEAEKEIVSNEAPTQNNNNNDKDGKSEVINDNEEEATESQLELPNGVQVERVNLDNIHRFSQRTKELQSKLRDAQTELIKERGAAHSMISQLRSRVEDSGAHILRIQQKSEDLENKIEQFQGENDALRKTVQHLQTELTSKTQLQSTTQTFYEMRRKEDLTTLNNLEKQVEKLETTLRKKELEKCDWEAKVSKLQNDFIESRNSYERDVNLLKDKMASLTQLSQEEIQQAFQLTMSELQGILDSAKSVNNRSNNRQNSSNPNINRPIPSNPNMNRPNPSNVRVSGNNSNNRIAQRADDSTKKIIDGLMKSLDHEREQRKSLEYQVQKWREIASKNEKKIYHLTGQQDLIDRSESADPVVKLAKSLSASVTPRPSPSISANSRRVVERNNNSNNNGNNNKSIRNNNSNNGKNAPQRQQMTPRAQRVKSVESSDNHSNNNNNERNGRNNNHTIMNKHNNNGNNRHGKNIRNVGAAQTPNPSNVASYNRTNSLPVGNIQNGPKTPVGTVSNVKLERINGNTTTTNNNNANENGSSGLDAKQQRQRAWLLAEQKRHLLRNQSIDSGYDAETDKVISSSATSDASASPTSPKRVQKTINIKQDGKSVNKKTEQVEKIQGNPVANVPNQTQRIEQVRIQNIQQQVPQVSQVSQVSQVPRQVIQGQQVNSNQVQRKIIVESGHVPDKHASLKKTTISQPVSKIENNVNNNKARVGQVRPVGPVVNNNNNKQQQNINVKNTPNQQNVINTGANKVNMMKQQPQRIQPTKPTQPKQPSRVIGNNNGKNALGNGVSAFGQVPISQEERKQNVPPTNKNVNNKNTNNANGSNSGRAVNGVGVNRVPTQNTQSTKGKQEQTNKIKKVRPQGPPPKPPKPPQPTQKPNPLENPTSVSQISNGSQVSQVSQGSQDDVVGENERWFLNDEQEVVILHDSMVEAKYRRDTGSKASMNDLDNNNNNNEEFKRSEMNDSEYLSTNLAEMTGKNVSKKIEDESLDTKESSESKTKLTKKEIDMIDNEENFQNFQPFKQQNESLQKSFKKLLRENNLDSGNSSEQVIKNNNNNNNQDHPIDCINDDNIETTEHGYINKEKGSFFNFFNAW